MPEVEPGLSTKDYEECSVVCSSDESFLGGGSGMGQLVVSMILFGKSSWLIDGQSLPEASFTACQLSFLTSVKN